MAVLPPMPEDWEDTRSTLHAYAHAASALPRALIPAHDKWWHTSLKPTPEGLVSDPIILPEEGTVTVRMDLHNHAVVLETSDARRRAWPMDAGLTGTELGDELIAAAGELGLSADFDRERFESDDPRPYDPAAASAFYDVLEAVAAVFGQHRATLEGEVSPVQLWPHGFDLSFEWFGTRVEEFEEDGSVVEYPSQLNLGFYPAGDAYFYSNPWPFDVDTLIEQDLPEDCTWNIDGWQGTKLRYADLAGDDGATDRLLEFAQRVFEIARPTLTV